MSDIKSAYKAVALAVWQRLIEQDLADLEELNQIRPADSKIPSITPQASVPVRENLQTNPDN